MSVTVTVHADHNDHTITDVSVCLPDGRPIAVIRPPYLFASWVGEAVLAALAASAHLTPIGSDQASDQASDA